MILRTLLSIVFLGIILLLMRKYLPRVYRIFAYLGKIIFKLLFLAPARRRGYFFAIWLWLVFFASVVTIGLFVYGNQMNGREVLTEFVIIWGLVLVLRRLRLYLQRRSARRYDLPHR